MKKRGTHTPTKKTDRYHQATQAYILLRKKVTGAGILNRSYTYYTILISVIVFCFGYSAYMIFVTPLSWQLTLWCLLFGFFTVQIGGLMHDAGHRAIANSTKMNDLWGYVFGAITAVGYSAWNSSHNKHHSHTNQEDEDPDLDLPLHGFTKRQFEKQTGIWRMLRPFQAYIWYPLRTLSVFTRRAELPLFLRDQKRLRPSPELFVWGAGVFVYFALPFCVFDFAKASVVFLAVHIFTGFYMSNIFAPNHKGMPQLPKTIKISFLEHQIMTSRNIHGHWLTDFIFMGLNYQIEHHLFPNCPRHKLKHISPYVLAICRNLNLDYTSVSILESNKIILSELSKVAKS